jgi:hypothetical protein
MENQRIGLHPARPRAGGCQEIVRTGKFVVPAEAGIQGKATEMPRFPLSRERREASSSGGSELDYNLAGGDPGPAPLRQIVVKIPPSRIMPLNQLQFPRTAPFLYTLFAEDRIGHGLMKLDKH